MKRLRLKMRDHTLPDCEHRDAQRIVDAFARHGVACGLIDAHTLWEMHSEDYCAGWLIMPSKDEDLERDLGLRDDPEDYPGAKAHFEVVDE